MYITDSLGVFLRKIAFDYLRFGYARYVLRTIPEGKDLEKVDRKILKAYGVTFHHATRARRRKNGLGNVVYIRFGHRFILMASNGSHEAFDKLDCKDLKNHPLLFDGYSVGVKRGKPCIMIPQKRFKPLRKKLLAVATHDLRKVQNLFDSISPFQFPEVVRQKQKLLTEINQKRRVAGLPLLKN